MLTKKGPDIALLWLKVIFFRRMSLLSIFSRQRRSRFARSAEKRRKLLRNIIGGEIYSDVDVGMTATQSTEHLSVDGAWKNSKKIDAVPGFSVEIQTDIDPQYAACEVLLVCQHAPTVGHAGGLRILDILHNIKHKYARTYIEIFTPANLNLYGPLGELSQIVDRIVIADDYDFSLGEYLRRAPKRRYFDIVDFQFPQSLEIIKSYRDIGRKLIFTPMESHIRNECIERGIEFIPEKELTSHNALEEAKICRLVDQTICVSDKDRAAVAGCVEVDVIAIETGISEIEFTGEFLPVNPNDRAVCYVAYFGSETNREALRWYLMYVHPRIREVLDDYEFRIIGRGDISDILADTPDGVRYVGEVERLAPHIKAAAIGIAPALSGSGFRGKINQYAYLGVPTVAATLAVDGLAYVDGDSILIADDPGDFANCIVKLLQNSEVRLRLGAAAAEVCRSVYGWEAQWPAIAEVYDLPPRPQLIALPTVHAVVPSYQHAAFIEERLRSIFDQQYPNIRVTVIDDHSNDGSHEIIERLRDEFEFDYIRREHQSGTPFGAWEYAAENTTEDLIWICESDDSCDRMLVGKLVQQMTMRRRAKIAYCASWIVDEQGERLGSTEGYHSEAFRSTRWQHPFISRGNHELRDYQRFGTVVPNMSGALFDAEVFRAALTPNVKNYKLAGDWLFVGQAMQFGDVVYVPERLNRFRQHDETARSRTGPARRTAEHISVRLALSALSDASEYEVIDAVKYDLRDLFEKPDLADQVKAEMQKLSPEREEQLADLLREHCSGKEPSVQLARALELGGL